MTRKVITDDIWKKIIPLLPAPIARRYDKTTVMFKAGIVIACIFMWLKL